MPHRIDAVPLIDPRTGRHKLDSRGMLYMAVYEGKVIVPKCYTPFLDGCRALLARGITGPAEMWSPNGKFPRLRGSIERAAKQAVREGPRDGPLFVKFHSTDWAWTASDEGAGRVVADD